MASEEKERKMPDASEMEAAVARLCRPTTFRMGAHPDPLTPTQYRRVLSTWTAADRRIYGPVHFARVAAYLLHELDTEEAFDFAFFLARYHGDAPQQECRIPDVDPTPEEYAQAQLTEDDVVMIGGEGPVLTMLLIGTARYVDVLFGLRTHPPEVTSVPHIRYHIRPKDINRFRVGFAHAVAVWLFKDRQWPRAMAAVAAPPAVQRYFRYLDGYQGMRELVRLLKTPFMMMGSEKHFRLYGRLQGSEERDSEYLLKDPEQMTVITDTKLHLPPCLARLLKRVHTYPAVYHSKVLWLLTRDHPELLDTIADPARRAVEYRVAADAIAEVDAAALAAAADNADTEENENKKKPRKKDFNCNYMWLAKLCPLQWASGIEEVPTFQRIKTENVAYANKMKTECTQGKHVGDHCAKLCQVRLKYVSNPKAAIYYTP
jgi:hypothetical protein